MLMLEDAACRLAYVLIENKVSRMSDQMASVCSCSGAMTLKEWEHCSMYVPVLFLIVLGVASPFA